MSAVRLNIKAVEKPWGRTDLPTIFPHPDNKKIGEIWFEGPEGQHPPLLIKYIFTSERLSIQVHPTDAEGRARGLPGGKTECWYILHAEPDATLGIGTIRPLNGEELRAAALDGSIETLMDWKKVSAGDFFYIAAGTVHAIGAGITLIETQQNVDVTYRLYDYGRPRELHLDDGAAVSRAEPYALPPRSVPLGNDTVLLDGHMQPFSLEMHALGAGDRLELSDGKSWLIPVRGEGSVDGQSWHQGECWLIDGDAAVTAQGDADILIAKVARPPK